MIAPGTIVVEFSVKKSCTSIGGVVGETLVKEGDEVEAGQIVLRLDDTVTRATLGVGALPAHRVDGARGATARRREDAEAIVFRRS